MRLHAETLGGEAWVEAELDRGLEAAATGGEEGKEAKKQWGWTLFSAELPVPAELLSSAGHPREAALVAYATDAEGQRQEVQTAWNLRGVAEASWSVVKVKVQEAEA